MAGRAEGPRLSGVGGGGSPEFEFWMVRNPSRPPPHLLTADELIVDGVLLPLHLLPKPTTQTNQQPDPLGSKEPVKDPDPPSKRWTDIFKVVGVKKPAAAEDTAEKKKECRNTRAGGGGGVAELNINIWPFSRSRSAGDGARPKPAVPFRKASSAPCSRSNSRGESAGARRWAASPGRSGVHVGRASPVWKLRRSARTCCKAPAGDARTAGGEKKSSGSGIRGLNLNVNTCIGYGRQVSYGKDGDDGISAGSGGRNEGSEPGDVGGNGGLFNIRTLFTKKVY